MRKPAGLIFVLLLCLGLVWWFWPKESSPLPVTAASTNPPPSSAPIVTASNPQATVPATDEARKAAKLQERIEAAKELLSSGNVSIRFWGRVIDQDDKPLDGVKIKGHVAHGYMAVPGYISEKSDQFEVLSREDGNFTIEGLTGSVLEIAEVSKEGYEPSPANRWSFAYYDSSPSSIFKPDPNAPVILRMWRKSGAARLIYADKFYGIVPDGRIYGIDMLKGQKVEGGSGDFKVQIWRPTQINPQTKYNWSFVIEGVDGGVIESSDEFMYQAPESGYQPRYEYTMNPTDANWQEMVRKNFYVKSRSGQVYGRMNVEVRSSYQDKAVFSVKYFANPEGSRNLEYDPAQALKAK
jgi:hypothetical protein